MSSIEQIHQDNDELKMALRPIRDQRVKDVASTKVYSKVVDGHTDTTESLHAELDAARKEKISSTSRCDNTGSTGRMLSEKRRSSLEKRVVGREITMI